MVFVDTARTRYRGMIMCHMVADSVDELHVMAEKLGLKRSWFQTDSSLLHYDICQAKRKLALQLGAQEIDRRSLVEMIRRHRG